MQHPFSVLSAEYTSLLSQMVVLRTEEVDEVARKLLDLVAAGRYDAACSATGVPRVWAAASFEREASSNFRLSPAQGDPWDEVSRHVPAGYGPFASWSAAAEWFFRHEALDKVGASSWTWERCCYEAELFNGFGYRARGTTSPYLWAGTNNYSSGKFVADGRFDHRAVDQQLGVVPVMVRMAQVNASLSLGGGAPSIAGPATASVMIAPPEGLHDAEALQRALNVLRVAGTPLLVDGSYGRMTRGAVAAFQRSATLPVDGYAGPRTWAAIESALSRRG